MNTLTYDDLTDEDKLLMDGLFIHKEKKKEERKILRDIIQLLRSQEMDCTKDIMNLSQRKIGEKFDLGPNAARPLTKRNKEGIKDRLSIKEIKDNNHDAYKRQKRIMSKINEKKTCSQNGQQSVNNRGRIEKNSLCHC